MMLGLQGSASSSKVYRCVACSATFTGLASLLVHQASHASALSKVSTPPQHNISLHESPFTHMDSTSVRPTQPALLPETPSLSFFICDCGEEFQDFGLMLEHKRSHVSEQLPQPLDNNNDLSETISDGTSPTQHVKFSQTVTQTGLVLSCPSTSQSSAVKLPAVTDREGDVSLKDGIAIVTDPQGKPRPPQDDGENQVENMSATAEQSPDTVGDKHLKEKTNSVDTSDSLPRKNKTNLMKLLASAYTNSFPASQSIDNRIDGTLTPKQEVVPVEITPAKKSDVINDLSVAQLKRLLATPGIKTKAPSISKVLESSQKRVVSLTKIFSPVVVLETRQKLKEPNSNGTQGRYQCGRCRKVFQSIDRLTDHHFLHKKERIKCCRRCKQLIIGRMPLPDNHVCPQLGNNTMRSLKNKTQFPQKVVPFHGMNNTRKVFFCPICKHSYARRWNLKQHKCQGPRPALSSQTNPSIQKLIVLRSTSKIKQDEGTGTGPEIKNVGVGPEVSSCIKKEVISPDSEQCSVSQLAWTHPAESFSPSYSKCSMKDQHKDSTLREISQEGENWEAAEDEDSNEGQWTMPLDDDMEVLASKLKADKGGELNKSVQHAETVPSSLRYFVRDGVKRYPCNRCQKTYSRPSTLRRHLRLCGFRPRGFVSVAQSGSHGTSSLNSNNIKPIKAFPCFVCGRNFNRKDNMMVHSKKCRLQRAITNVDTGSGQQSISGSATDRQTKEDDDGGNWGIMSLPSVLPRRVTCECGVGFTSPRLLLEHLQKHAQESYTCPTCGETVNSWADYEVHLQIHMHPHHQLLKGILPQRTQPLLLRFQQQHTPQQPSPPVHQPLQRQTVKTEPFQNSVKKRIVCMRCGNTFSSRCSLRRHVSWNRCKGARATNPATNPPKTYHCSNCNSDFPNTISLMFHQRSGACKPAIKPVRCPVCLRWFGTVDGLEKHMLTHKQSQSFRCDVCQGTYPSLKSLKNHRRRIHRIMAGDTNPNPPEQLDT